MNIENTRGKFTEIKETLITTLKRWGHKMIHPSDALLTGYLLIVVALCCFGHSLITNHFTIPLGGDYTLQEMTFLFNGYDDWHTFFRTGSFPIWDRSIFLGIDNVGGNSFYYLFDPFFLICLPFPRDWLLTLQGLGFIPKTVLAGMFFYWYLGSFEFSNKTRRMGALVFGFSAYSFSYLWFHFIDSVAFLPLLFLGLERIIQKRDPRIFLIANLLNAMASYFFFVVFMIGAFLYAIFRYFQTIRTRNAQENWRVIGLGFVSFVVSVLLGAFILLPGMSVATSMPRVTSANFLETFFNAEGLSAKLDVLFNFGIYDHNRVTPLLNFLFMYDGCYYSNLLNVYWYDNFVAGLYVTTPMLLLFFVSLIDAIKAKKWSILIGLGLTAFLIFTPIGFYLFSGFTVGYARYFILPISWMVVFDCRALERRRVIPRNYLDLSFVITLALMMLSCYLMIYIVNIESYAFTRDTNWDLRMVLIPASVIWTTLCYVLMRFFFHKRKFSRAIFILSSLDIIVMANITIQFQGFSYAPFERDIPEETKIVQLLKEDENNKDYYRLFSPTADRGNINISLRIGYQGLGSFHSVYAYEAQNFIDRSRIPYSYHNWSMGIHNRRYNLETFLGTKYYLLDRIDPNYMKDHLNSDYSNHATPLAYPVRQEDGYYVWAKDYNVPYGYKDVTLLTEEEKQKYGVSYSSELLDYLKSDQCTKALYLNTNFVDFAFAYDQVINETWLATNLSTSNDEIEPFYNAYEDENEYPLLRAAILENQDYQTFYKEGKYNAGTYTINSKTFDIEGQNKNLASQSSYFRSCQVATTRYIEGSSAPIEVWQVMANTNRLKVDVYAAQWPGTERNPSGEYASCSVDDPNDNSCLDAYAKDHPWEYQNGIRPSDLKYDYETRLDDNGKRDQAYNREVLYNSKIVITPTDYYGNPRTIMPEADPSDPLTGGYISIFDMENIEWRLFDENDVVISYGKHSYSNYKQAHGYYVDRPVAKILGIIQSGTKENPVYVEKPILYVQRNKDYQTAIDKLKEEPVTITYRVDDEVRFDTNYSKDKFVVLNYPRSKGWKLLEIVNGKEVEIKTYKAQGGFIGFEGKEGQHHYVLRYTSDSFVIGMTLTTIGLVITFIAFVFYSMRHKYEHRFDELETLEYNQKKSIKEVQFDYANFEDQE